MERTSAGAPGSQSNRVGRAAAWSVFLQDRLVLGRWTLVPGVRYESIGFTQTDYARTDPGRSAPTRVVENGVDVLIPGMGVNVDVSAMLSLFGGVHKGFGPPGPGADRETRAEGSVNYELGARYRRGALGLQAVGFFNDYDNVLGKATLATGGSGAGELFNGGRVDVAGVELVVDYDAAARAGRPFRLPLRLAYTLTRAEFRTDFESEYELWGSVQAGDELPYMPRHQLFGSASLESAAVALRLSGHYSSEMRTVAGQGRIPPVESADAQLIFDLSGEYRVAPWGSVIAAIQNLSDRSYVVARHPAGVRPGLPRTFSLGLRLAR
ncbi:MAG: TonB-dependent receptor [Gemmatimonadetes bacterium]|nr:TonB-dependent receptor [Gemmatimonadota bacterium]